MAKKSENKNQVGPSVHHCCCPDGATFSSANPPRAISRRSFLQGVGLGTLGSITINHLGWASLRSGGARADTALSTAASADPRLPLKVKPVLVYSTPQRAHQTSWRAWGGIQTQHDAEQEISRIQGELAALKKKADFPVEFLPISSVRQPADLSASHASDISSADAIIVYAAGAWMDVFSKLEQTGKELIFFLRHRSGPVYLWYEIISPRYLRQHTDSPALERVTDDDVVIDSQEELEWRLRSLCGLRNTLGAGIIAIGGPDAWSQPPGVVPKLVEEKWKFAIKTISYEDLGRLIQEARRDTKAVREARQAARDYLKLPGTKLETELAFVENAFLLKRIFIAQDYLNCPNCRLNLRIICPYCGKETFFGDYCEHCGARLVVVCPNPGCKTEQPPIEDKCIKCGKPIK